MPKVSIIVPVYNVKRYIVRSMDSLVNQTLKDIEIIVVNDGSTDNSKKLIEIYQEKYPNKIKLVDKEKPKDKIEDMKDDEEMNDESWRIWKSF